MASLATVAAVTATTSAVRAASTVPAARSASAPPLAVADLAPGMHWIRGAPGDADRGNGGETGNVVFIVGTRGVVVWNAGVSRRHGERIVAAIRTRTSQPIRWLVLERPWRDLLFGAGALRDQGARIVMHRDAAALMRSRCPACLDALKRELGEAAMQGSALPGPTDIVSDAEGGLDALAERISRDIGRRLTWIGLGHAAGPGAMAAFDPASGVLLAGDTVMPGCVHDWIDADAGGLRRALDTLQRWMSTLDEDTAVRRIVAHHGPVADPSAVVRTRRYVDALDAILGEQIAHGVDMLAATQSAHLPEFANDRDYAIHHPRNVTRRFLALEQLEAGTMAGATPVPTD